MNRDQIILNELKKEYSAKTNDQLNVLIDSTNEVFIKKIMSDIIGSRS